MSEGVQALLRMDSASVPATPDVVTSKHTSEQSFPNHVHDLRGHQQWYKSAEIVGGHVCQALTPPVIAQSCVSGCHSHLWFAGTQWPAQIHYGPDSSPAPSCHS